jgi:hypothetical protein
MGGTLSANVNSDVDCLVAAATNSMKYHMAARYGTPVVTLEWLRACWRTQSLVDPTPHRLKPFVGQVVCVTGILGGLRTFIHEQVAALGGEYSPDLTRSCTRLIAEVPSGDKYRYALAWNIPVVTTDWFFDSVNQFASLPTSSYLLMPSSGRPTGPIPRSPPLIIQPLGRVPQPDTPPRMSLKRSFHDFAPNHHPLSLSKTFLRSSAHETLLPAAPPPPAAVLQSLEQILSLCNLVCESALTPATVCELLVGADEELNPSLRAACIQYIADHYEEVLATEPRVSLPDSVQRDVLRIRLLPSASDASSTASESQALPVSDSAENPGFAETEPPAKRRRIAEI